MIGKVKATLEGSEQDGKDILLTFRVPFEERYAAVPLIDDCRYIELLLMVDKYRKKRTLDQNAFMWALLTELATVMKSDKDSLYIMMLERYGKWDYLICLDKAIPSLEKVYSHVQQIDEKVEDGKRMVKCMCFLGSSHYNTKDMTTLLDGVIDECKDAGIDTDVVWRAYESKGY